MWGILMMCKSNESSLSFEQKPFYLTRLLGLPPSDYMKEMNRYFNIAVCGVVISALLGIVIICHISHNELFDDIIAYLRLLLNLSVLVSITLLFIQSCTMRIHADTNYMLQKSHKAMDMLYKWSMDLGIELLLARKIVDRLNEHDVECLVKCQPFYLYINDYEILNTCMDLMGLKNSVWTPTRTGRK